MYSAFRLLKTFLIPTKAVLPLLAALLSFYPTQGKAERQDEWLSFPYSIQLSPYIGFTEKIPQRLGLEDSTKKEQNLRIIGLGADIGVFQIRSFLWKHFRCYPKLGLLLNYGRLENEGNILGGLFYLAPQYDYQARCELVPRLGIGIAYLDIPDTNSVKEKDKGKGIYRQGISLDLSLALACQFRLNPNWTLGPSISFNYMPYLSSTQGEVAEEEKEQEPEGSKKSLKALTAGLEVGYIPNPSYVRYPELKALKRSRVDLGFLSAFKKCKPVSQQAEKLNQQVRNIDKDKLYYVGGIYGHWSLWLGRNHAMTLATEWIKDWAAKELLKETLKTDFLKVSLLLGHEFLWGKIIFGQQLGVYLMNNLIQEEGLLYTRLGLEYRILESLFIGTSLKSSLKIKEGDFGLQTDFVDFRIGYAF